MSNLQNLLRQKADLEQAIENEIKQTRESSLARVHALMDELGVSVSDLRGGGKAGAKAGGKASVKTGLKVAAKYRDAATGQSWSGRGLKPRWLTQALADGRQLEDFAI